jgi:hypothetical protein
MEKSRKAYDIVILLMKTKRKHMETFKPWKDPLWAHMKSGLKFYENLFLQDHYELMLQNHTDGLSVHST